MLTLVLYVICLGVINAWVVRALHVVKDHRNFITAFTLVMGVTTLLATMLHAFEAGIWAVAYRKLGAMPDVSSGILYSLSAITTYGHAELYLARHWQLMGALEALNGLLLIGWSASYTYIAMERFWNDGGKAGSMAFAGAKSDESRPRHRAKRS